MSTGMRVGSIFSEALRDVVSGTSRAALYSLAFIVSVGLIAAIDVRSVVSVLQDVETFRVSGSTVQVVSVVDNIDGTRCDAIGQADGVIAAGGIRWTSSVRLWNLPSTPVTMVEATPGFIDLLRHSGQPIDADHLSWDGVWLAADLARTIGASPGDVIHSSTGPARVAGTYTWPTDGRDRGVAYSMISPVPASGTFSQCWADIWPIDAELSSLLYTSVIGAISPSNTRIVQLNSSLGVSLDAAHLLAHRVTAKAPWVALGVGFVLGFMSVRTRRLELASALHACVPRAHLAWQLMIECAIWVAGAVTAAAAALHWVARIGNPDLAWAPWAIGMRTTVVGAVAALLGVIVGTMSTREKHLYRYTKNP